MSDPTAYLHGELGLGPTPTLDALDQQQLTHLTSAIAAAQTRQQEALAAAMESGLEFVPRVLRGSVQKVLFG